MPDIIIKYLYMSKKLSFLIATIFTLVAINQAKAQYPKIPEQVQKETNTMMEAARQRSDIAWGKALPVIEEYAKQGKPYIPWAFRPTDLPQAEIAAFPGAEGGGKYTFGGRGGKVIVRSEERRVGIECRAQRGV